MERPQTTESHFGQAEDDELTGAIYWPEHRQHQRWLEMMERTEAGKSQRPRQSLSLRQFVSIHFLLIARCVGALVMLGVRVTLTDYHVTEVRKQRQSPRGRSPNPTVPAHPGRRPVCWRRKRAVKGKSSRGAFSRSWRPGKSDAGHPAGALREAAAGCDP